MHAITSELFNTFLSKIVPDDKLTKDSNFKELWSFIALKIKASKNPNLLAF